MELRRPLNGALAGATAAAVWAAQQPLDKRVFGSATTTSSCSASSSTRGPAWPAAGPGDALANGAIFGAVYALGATARPGAAARHGRRRRAWRSTWRCWPLGPRGRPRPPGARRARAAHRQPRAFAQATWRHLLFGVVLAEIERRLNDIAEFEPLEDIPASSNGHGSLEQAAVGAADG